MKVLCSFLFYVFWDKQKSVVKNRLLYLHFQLNRAIIYRVCVCTVFHYQASEVIGVLKRILSALSCASALMLSGCTGVSFTVDTLLNAPKFTEEQSAIHQALIERVGENITLKYPKNGDYRSAFVIADIDDEPTDEALVFYEYASSSGKNGLRVNILDKDEDGEWRSVKELAGGGTDIDRVVISSVGDSGDVDVLVGYQNLTSDEKTLEIYSYTDGEFERIATDLYSVLEPIDINSDGSNEIITISKAIDSETGQSEVTASLLRTQNGEITKDAGIKMCDDTVSYVKSQAGFIEGGRRALFVDGLDQDGNLMTEIVYYRYSSLQNPMEQRPDKLVPKCIRPAGYYSTDIDGDGIIEIPTTSPMIGYENAVTEEMVYTTTWSSYHDFYDLDEEYSGYYSITDGYFFAFPKRWNSSVTVKKDSESGELVFYKFTGDINTSSEELLRIAVSAKNKTERYTSDGYEVVGSKGQLDYVVKLPLDKREKLIPTVDEVKNNLYITN